MISEDRFCLLANSEGPDEILHSVVFHLGLHYLQKYLFRGFQSTKGPIYSRRSKISGKGFQMYKGVLFADFTSFLFEPVHEISNNVVCVTSKASEQPAHTCSLIRAFASHLSILWLLSYWLKPFGVSKLKRRLQRLVGIFTCQNATLLDIPCTGSNISMEMK